jgi:YhgE/Pip-like protein
VSEPPPDPSQVRASRLLRRRAVWAAPAIVGSVVVLLMTVFYIGAIVDPTSHLRGLPVTIVNEDAGVKTAGGEVNFGKQVSSGLLASPRVSTLLALKSVTLARAEERMNAGKDFAAIVIPPRFTASLLELYGTQLPAGEAAGRPTIELLTNLRAGSVGVSLATNIVGPAVAEASHQLGQRLLSSAAAKGTGNTAFSAVLADPITFSPVVYRPLPANSALGLSAFYIALLTMLCGFLGAIVVNTSVDTALGYATTDIGPRWRQLRPLAISRWHTLLTKLVVALLVTAILTGVMLATAVGILGMDAPDGGYLWLYCWFAAATIAAGTLVLFAILGTPGQLVAMLLFVYLGLASAGGTIPVQALPGVLRLVSDIDPLRQILSGVRSILYFGAQGDAGLIRGLVLTAIGLVFWLGLGTIVVTWYDRKGLARIQPATLAYIHQAAAAYSDKPDDSAKPS